MPEGVSSYPRWKGPLSTGPSFPAIVAEEWQRAWKSMWFQLAFFLVLGWTILSLGGLYSLKQARGDTVHTFQAFLDFLGNLRWGALFMAAIIAGPSLLEDARRGALELYLARAVTRLDYLLGKTLAAFLAALGAIVIPGILYWALSFVLFERHPADWTFVPLGVLAYGLLWALVVTGLGMGLSAVSRTSRAAALILVGSFALADRVLSVMFESITRDPRINLLSPLANLQQQQEWMFGQSAPFDFPAWWGLVALVALMAVGWGLLAWKHPRVAGG